MSVKFQAADGTIYHSRIGAAIDTYAAVVKDYFNEGDIYGTVDGVLAILEAPLVWQSSFQHHLARPDSRK